MANFADGNDITGTDLLEWSRHQSSATSCIKKKGKRSTYSGLISLITPCIYLGNKAASSDLDLLKRLSIVAILNIGGGKCYFPNEFEYFRIAIKDSEEVSFLPYFEEACNFAQSWRKRGSILFHCRGGMHRSPSFLAAYLMRNESLSLTQALEVISLGRPIANPTPHMIYELKEFEKTSDSIKL